MRERRLVLLEAHEFRLQLRCNGLQALHVCDESLEPPWHGPENARGLLPCTAEAGRGLLLLEDLVVEAPDHAAAARGWQAVGRLADLHGRCP